MDNPINHFNKMRVAAFKRALSELNREDLETFALIEASLVLYMSQVVGEPPNVGCLERFGFDYDWLEETTEIINKVIQRSHEIVNKTKEGN